MIKQVLVVRSDVKMRRGKESAQIAHASLKVFLDWGRMTGDAKSDLLICLTPEMKEWIEGSFTKIVLGTDSEASLDDIYAKALSADLPCALVIDNGDTEFHGVKTKTVVAIGPAKAEEIDKITGHLDPR